MFNNTNYALGLDTNWRGDSRLWNPLLYSIDQKRFEIIKIIMEELIVEYPQFIGLCLREYKDFIDEKSESFLVQQKNYGLVIAISTTDLKIIDYILNYHYYLWDKESILSMLTTYYYQIIKSSNGSIDHHSSSARSMYKYYYMLDNHKINVSPISFNVSQYLPSLQYEEQISFIKDLLEKSCYSKEIVNILLHPKISTQLLIGIMNPEYYNKFVKEGI